MWPRIAAIVVPVRRSQIRTILIGAPRGDPGAVGAEGSALNKAPMAVILPDRLAGLGSPRGPPPRRPLGSR